jgi:hypothetical protein
MENQMETDKRLKTNTEEISKNSAKYAKEKGEINMQRILALKRKQKADLEEKDKKSWDGVLKNNRTWGKQTDSNVNQAWNNIQAYLNEYEPRSEEEIQEIALSWISENKFQDGRFAGVKKGENLVIYSVKRAEDMEFAEYLTNYWQICLKAPKDDPFPFYLRGPSGCGKSWMLLKLVANLRKLESWRFLYINNPASLISGPEKYLFNEMMRMTVPDDIKFLDNEMQIEAVDEGNTGVKKTITKEEWEGFWKKQDQSNPGGILTYLLSRYKEKGIQTILILDQADVLYKKSTDTYQEKRKFVKKILSAAKFTFVTYCASNNNPINTSDIDNGPTDIEENFTANVESPTHYYFLNRGLRKLQEESYLKHNLNKEFWLTIKEDIIELDNLVRWVHKQVKGVPLELRILVKHLNGASENPIPQKTMDDAFVPQKTSKKDPSQKKIMDKVVEKALNLYEAEREAAMSDEFDKFNIKNLLGMSLWENDMIHFLTQRPLKAKPKLIDKKFLYYEKHSDENKETIYTIKAVSPIIRKLLWKKNITWVYQAKESAELSLYDKHLCRIYEDLMSEKSIYTDKSMAGKSLELLVMIITCRKKTVAYQYRDIKELKMNSSHVVVIQSEEQIFFNTRSAESTIKRLEKQFRKNSYQPKEQSILLIPDVCNFPGTDCWQIKFTRVLNVDETHYIIVHIDLIQFAGNPTKHKNKTYVTAEKIDPDYKGIKELSDLHLYNVVDKAETFECNHKPCQVLVYLKNKYQKRMTYQYYWFAIEMKEEDKNLTEDSKIIYLKDNEKILQFLRS